MRRLRLILLAISILLIALGLNEYDKIRLLVILPCPACIGI